MISRERIKMEDKAKDQNSRYTIIHGISGGYGSVRTFITDGPIEIKGAFVYFTQGGTPVWISGHIQIIPAKNNKSK